MRLLGCDITQLYVFLLFAALGAVLGGVYLLLYMLTRHGGFWAVFADVAFGCAAVAAVCGVNLLFNNGEARLYVPLGLACGVCASVVILYKPLDKVACRLYNRLTFKRKEQDDGSTVSQKIHGNTDDCGNSACCAVGVRTADYAVANDVHDDALAKVANPAGKRTKKQRGQTGSPGLHQDRRVHRPLGGRKGSY